MLIKRDVYLQKTFKISIVFYTEFNVKHLSKFGLDGCKIQNGTKII